MAPYFFKQSARSLLGNPFIDMFRDLSPFWLHPNDISQRICTTNVVVMNTVGAAESQNTLPTNFIFASRLYKTIQQSMVEMYQWYTTYSMYYIVTSPPQKKNTVCVSHDSPQASPNTPNVIFFFAQGSCFFGVQIHNGRRLWALFGYQGSGDVAWHLPWRKGTERRRSSVGQVCYAEVGVEGDTDGSVLIRFFWMMTLVTHIVSSFKIVLGEGCLSSKKSFLEMLCQLVLKNHQEFQVPKMEVLNLLRPFWGWVFPSISLTYSLYRWVPPF